MKKGWKYGLIKVSIEDEGTDIEEQINLLVELYPLGDNGEYRSFCKADLRSIEDLHRAQKDIERDGINEWFYDNGAFHYRESGLRCYEWDWKNAESTVLDAAQQVIEDHSGALEKLDDNEY